MSKKNWVIFAVAAVSLMGIGLSFQDMFLDGDFHSSLPLYSIITMGAWIFGMTYFAKNSKDNRKQLYGLGGLLIFYGVLYLCKVFTPLSAILSAGFFGTLKLGEEIFGNSAFIDRPAYGVMFLLFAAVNIALCLAARKKNFTE